MIGHLSLDQPGVRYEFTDKQIRIVTSIAAQAAVALHNARTFEREHRIAQALQEAVLAPPERIDGLEVSALLPSGIGDRQCRRRLLRRVRSWGQSA